MFFSLLLSAGLATAYCPPGDIVFPPSLIDYSAVSSTISSNLSSTFDGLVSNGTRFNATSSSFSIELTSPNASFYEYHHGAADRNTSGVETVDSNSLYRIASMSKLVTFYSLLVAGVDIDKPVMEYVPALKKYGAKGDWATITSRQLGNHMSGITRDGWYADLANFVQQAKGGQSSAISNASISVPDYFSCKLGDASCERDAFFRSVVDDGFNYPSSSNPAYANMGFILLGLVLEAATGKSYSEATRSLLFDPLTMNGTSVNLPPSSKGVIPVSPSVPDAVQGNSTYWDFIGGISNPSGGVYSTTSDISKMLRSIISNKLLTAKKTREWMKPGGFTQSPYESVGTPWEIFRRTTVTPDARPINLYTKSGWLHEYASITGIVPDYAAGFTVLVSARVEDSSPAVSIVQNLVVQELLPALEANLRLAVSSAYSGTYTDAASNSSMSITLDNGPGLHIAAWTAGETDLLNALSILHQTPLATPAEGRLVWSGKGNTWFIYFDFDLSASQGPKNFFGSCTTWEVVDFSRYNGVSIDHFVFEMSGDGKQATGIAAPALNVTMTKV